MKHFHDARLLQVAWHSSIMHVLNSLSPVSFNYIWLDWWSVTDITIASRSYILSHSALYNLNSATQLSELLLLKQSPFLKMCVRRIFGITNLNIIGSDANSKQKLGTGPTGCIKYRCFSTQKIWSSKFSLRRQWRFQPFGIRCHVFFELIPMYRRSSFQ
jgi:hypothetical protein